MTRYKTGPVLKQKPGHGVKAFVIIFAYEDQKKTPAAYVVLPECGEPVTLMLCPSRPGKELDSCLKTAEEMLSGMIQPRSLPEETALLGMLACAEKHALTIPLLNRDLALVPLSELQAYVSLHRHDGYDYASMPQPNTCLHFPETVCGYPIADCPNCPMWDTPDTVCTLN